MIKRIITGLLLFLICSVQLNCGYSTRSSLPSNFKTLYVEMFKNSVSYANEGGRDLYLPLLEVKVKNAITQRFLFDGNLRIAKNAEDADLILKGELKSYNRAGLRYTDDENVQEYRVQVFVNTQMINNEKQEPVWQESNMVGESTYFVSGPQAKSESTAVDAALIDLARRMVERTVEDW